MKRIVLFKIKDSLIWPVVLHHRINNLLPLLLQIFPLLIPLLQLPLLIQRSQQQTPLLILLNLSHSWIWIIICPFYRQHLISVQSLVSHGLFCELGHATVCEFDKGVSFVRKDVDVLDFAPNCEMSQQHFVHLGDSVFIAGKFKIAYVDGFGLFGKTSNSFHIFSERTEPGSTENVFCLINRLTILKRGNFMIVFAVDAIGAATSGKEKTVKGSSFLIKEICSCVSHIELWVASRKRSFFIFLILRADILAIPEVILLISLLISVVVGQRSLDLFAGRSFESISEGQILFLLVFDEFFGDVLVDIETRFGCSFEGGEIGLYSGVEFLRQLPN